jgi:Haem-NO-binding
MYGVIFDMLRSYVIERHGGRPTWDALLDQAGIGYKVYFPVAQYPDEEMVNLATTASKMLNLPVTAVLEDFGTFVGPSLVTYYDMFVRPEWRTFDVLENASAKIHDAIHRHNPRRNPPELRTTRVDANRMKLTYQSERKLCFVAKGIILGLAHKYGERIDVRETQCMHSGAERCHFDITHRGDTEMAPPRRDEFWA